jgi:CRISPR/Cas system-associated endonuclease/helicase Cas3
MYLTFRQALERISPEHIDTPNYAQVRINQMIKAGDLKEVENPKIYCKVKNNFVPLDIKTERLVTSESVEKYVNRNYKRKGKTILAKFSDGSTMKFTHVKAALEHFGISRNKLVRMAKSNKSERLNDQLVKLKYV